MIDLSDSQKKAIQKLEKLRVGALFMEPGTGKTRTAIELINSSAADFVLWIVPFQTKQNLKAELDKWGLEKKYRIEGVESLSNSDRLYMELLGQLKKYQKVFMVVDESLKIKNRWAKRSKRVLELGKLSYYRLILNGTPLSRNILDLWEQMEFLSPLILKMNFYQYKYKFCEYSQTLDEGGNYREYISGYANVEYLYSLIEPYVFDAKLNLKIAENEKRVEYWIEDPSKYNQLKRQLLSDIGSMGDYDVFGIMQQMQQSYSLDGQKLYTADRLIHDLKRSSIIFVKYIKTKETLTLRYPNCLVLTYGKGSLGLNLQKYKNIIFYDKTWDYAQLEQAKRRIYRLGQSEDVRYYFMDGDVGLENMINGCIGKKTTMLQDFKRASKHMRRKEWIKNAV